MGRDTCAADKRKWEQALLRGATEADGSRGMPWIRLLDGRLGALGTRRHRLTDIDLLGVSRLHLPIIVAADGPDSMETPLQLLVRATARGTALREAWPIFFRELWTEMIGGGISPLPEELSTCELVCAAPAAYWDRWAGEGPLSNLMGFHWAVLLDVTRSLLRGGFRVLFLRLEHEALDADGLPTRITVAEQPLPGRRVECPTRHSFRPSCLTALRPSLLARFFTAPVVADLSAACEPAFLQVA